MDTKYSVLMSLYYKENSEHFKTAVYSMLNQSIKPDEIIIVKDGPLTEALETELQRFDKEYENVFNIVELKENVGLGKALNIGLKQCRNELVARMDTDDISAPDRCAQQLKSFSYDPELSIVGTNISEFVESADNIVSYRTVPEDHNSLCEYIKKRCPFNHMTVMFKKSKVEEAGGYLHWFYNEDYYLWIRMYLAKMKFGNLPEALVNVRVGKELYKRRGGLNYFKSEVKLQKYMLNKRVISFSTYMINVLKRLIIQVILPASVRGILFKKFARSKSIN